MKAKITILVLLCPIYLVSQEKISGQVLDKETLKPVSGVVVHTNSGNTMTMTNDKGYYTLDVHSSEVVYFRHLAYDFFETTPDALLNNSAIYLTLNAVELSEVVVSPIHAEQLLNHALQNLRLKLQKEATFYLLHIDNTTTIGGERKAYAIIKANRSRLNHKHNLYWKFDLIQLDKISTLNESSFKPVRIEFFPYKYALRSQKNCTYELYETKENQWVIKVSPKHLNKRYYRYALYTINKQDTMLIESVQQSYSNADELTKVKVRNNKVQMINYFSRITFAQDEATDFYYLKTLDVLGNIRISGISSYDELFNMSSKMINDITTAKAAKKINAQDYNLFKSNFPNSPGFWKKYIQP
ncbi:hypothetical protein SAMD00024442_81_6 [Candidatus Symbiothrix dinenymphae]|nr:hypothetical protein SAMD00024442_81_6 [Candidatus Symbiothrix dinenymphae]